MSKYTKLQEQINKLDKEIEETEQAIAETHERVDRSQETLDGLWLSLKRKVLEGEETDIRAVEQAIDKTKKLGARDRAGLEALQEKLPALRQKRQTLVDDQTEIIARVADTWFVKEIERYEQAREQFLRVAHRLSACSTLLHASERGRAVAAGHLGEVWPYFRAMRIPSVKIFSAARYANDRPSADMVSSPEEREEVKNELTQ
ncbi:hypothetical protein [Syntrophorhabdus aromaticivorans]|uniref:hypothetical protein n=1 Tax=Syntrophorhabdus aromaticivorans TaxID=328301 RepID=UPI0004019B70|nr:hypothetical protein [Syntrophorhabdus aromaticivorans]